MSYTLDKTSKAYHLHISTQDIYVYSYNTPTTYLPDGYLGPTGIPYDDEDGEVEADEASLSDILLPLDDPFINAHAPRQACQCGPCYVDLKFHL